MSVSAQLPAAIELTNLDSRLASDRDRNLWAKATGRRGKEPTLIPAFPGCFSLSRPTVYNGQPGFYTVEVAA